MKKTTCVTVALSLLAGITMLYTSCRESVKEYGNPVEPTEIIFDAVAGAGPDYMAVCQLHYDAEKLQTTIDEITKKHTIYIFGDPKIDESYSMAETMGFNTEKYTSVGNALNERSYKWEGGALKLDQYGCFSYLSGDADGNTEIPFSLKECEKMARSYLKEKGLWSNAFYEGIGTGETVNTSYSEKEQEYVSTTVCKSIIYLPKPIDGIPISGNYRVFVKINSEGIVNNVTYNWREYQSRQKVDNLISVEEAIGRIRDGNAQFECETMAGEHNITDVFICYWAQNRNPNNLVMQPAYVFKGMTLLPDGSEEPFAITVQANRF